MEDTLNLTEASKALGITRQAIYMALRKGKLVGAKEAPLNRWKFTKMNILNYLTKKYDRTDSKDSKGNLKFDQDKGFFSPRMLAKITSIPSQKIYYLLRTGQLPHKKSGCSYIVHIDDVQKFR